MTAGAVPRVLMVGVTLAVFAVGCGGGDGEGAESTPNDVEQTSSPTSTAPDDGATDESTATTTTTTAPVDQRCLVEFRDLTFVITLYETPACAEAQGLFTSYLERPGQALRDDWRCFGSGIDADQFICEGAVRDLSFGVALDPEVIEGCYASPMAVTGCFYEAFRLQKADLASAMTARPELVVAFFEEPWFAEWELQGCEGGVCRYLEPNPNGGTTIVFSTAQTGGRVLINGIDYEF